MSTQVTDPPKDAAVAAAMDNDVEQGATTSKKSNVRTGDKTGEQMVIPKNRLVIVFIGLMLTVFLSALDQTIICIFRKARTITKL